MRLGIIGCGVMGEAIVRACLTRHVLSARSIVIHDREARKMAKLARLYNVERAKNLAALVSDTDSLLLAVKPQDATALLAELAPLITERHLLISIMAGIALVTLQSSGASKIVRSMPNLAARIGEGVTVYKISGTLSKRQSSFVERLFNAFGIAIKVNQEDLIDAATAITGSGPAYLFLFARALAEASRKLGFSSHQTKQMVNQLFVGSAKFLAQAKEDPHALIAQVASRGGTTERALAVFARGRLGHIVDEAVQAAYKRAKELAQ